MKPLRIVLAAVFALPLAAESAGAAEPENTLYLDTKDGRVVIALRPDLAPKHVARIKELVRKGFYDGLAFHRVIEGFMAQTGDPLGNGTGGSGTKLPAEFSKQPFERGTVGMARASDPNSGDSQFFICFAPAPFLNGKYTVWGQVTQGMDVVDKIKKGDSAANGAVQGPDKIVRMQVAADVKQ
jgi:peptidylprolyl isomerase